MTFGGLLVSRRKVFVVLQYCFLIVWCCLLAGRVAADTVDAYTATSVSFGHSTVHGSDSMSASGAGFSISGGGRDYEVVFASVGEQVSPLGVDFFVQVPVTAVGLVDFGGISWPANVTGDVRASSNTGFVIPPGPSSTYTFSAQATGEFSATPQFCGTPHAPPCDASAGILIDLPGELTITLTLFRENNPGCTQTGPLACEYKVDESFASTPVPEPTSGLLFFWGVVGMGGALLLRRRI